MMIQPAELMKQEWLKKCINCH